MKHQFKILGFISLLLLLLSTSCRSEETEIIETPPEDLLAPNSSVANLMLRTTMNDGSNDNIIDNSNCFNIQLPVTVIANGTQITVTSEEDYDAIEDLFDTYDDDSDTIEIIFPISIILSDFTEITINNSAELSSYSNNCNGENESDDDIECLDFIYPITASIFNSANELISSETFTNDYELYAFINDIDDNDLVSINFPITILLSDDTQLSINDFNELENTIELYSDDCDEDDDYDYNDDDCNDCSPNELQELLAACPDWHVDKLERNDVNYDEVYDGYDFNFFTNGTLTVYWNSITAYGSWSTSGTGNNITVVIDIPELPLCNNNWILHEIEQGGSETKIDLRLGDDDRLRYQNNACN